MYVPNGSHYLLRHGANRLIIMRLNACRRFLLNSVAFKSLTPWPLPSSIDNKIFAEFCFHCDLESSSCYESVVFWARCVEFPPVKFKSLSKHLFYGLSGASAFLQSVHKALHVISSSSLAYTTCAVRDLEPFFTHRECGPSKPLLMRPAKALHVATLTGKFSPRACRTSTFLVGFPWSFVRPGAWRCRGRPVGEPIGEERGHSPTRHGHDILQVVPDREWMGVWAGVGGKARVVDSGK